MRRIATLVTLLVVVLGACSDSSEPTADPEAALNAYADGINARSVDDVMAALAADARLIDHPLNPGVLNGKAEVRRAMTQTVTFARVDPDPYSISDVVVDDDTVSWSYVWVSDDSGQEFCDTIEMDVNDEGLIVEMRWGNDPDGCTE
jgi:hypothetical protein